MATSYTTNVGLGIPALGDTGWNVPLAADFNLLDSLAPVGGLAVRAKEIPSASLNVSIAPGSYIKTDGSIGTFPGASSEAMTANSTNYLFLDGTNSWALTVSTSAFPATAHVRLAVIVAGSSTISSITDSRQCFNVCGSIADGANLTLGTTTGTQIGTSSSQKIGFLGATPASQQTGGAATAGSTYTSVEQGLLNKCYSALRTFGLLS